MGVLFMGSEPEDFAIAVAHFTTSNVNLYADANFSRGYFNYFNADDWIAAPLLSAGTELWAHMYGTAASASGTHRIIAFAKSGGDAAHDKVGLKLNYTDGTISIFKYNGTTETVLASSSAGAATFSKATWDLYVKLGASGVVTAYINGAQVVTWTGDLTAITSDVDWIRFIPPSSGSQSEFIVHTEDTRQMRLQTRGPNAAGDTNTFTAGTYTAIDETPADLSDTVYSGTAAQVFQAKFPALPSAPGGGWIVRARKSNILAAKGLDAGPSSLDFGEKTNGTAYYPTTVALQNAWTSASITEETNPATGVRYTAAEAAAIQISLRSA